MSSTTAKSEGSMTSQSANKKQGSKTSYEEYKKKVLAESRLQARRRSELTSVELAKQNEAEKGPPDMSWIVKDKSEKKQHYEKTVNEIDKILSELKDKGVAEPESAEMSHANPNKSEEGRAGFEDGLVTSRKLSDGGRTQRDDVDQEQRKLDDEYRNLSLDDPRKKWGEAQKTRYVRSKDPRDVDVILSTDQIFDPENADESQKGWWKSYTQQGPLKQQTSPSSKKNAKKRNSIPN